MAQLIVRNLDDDTKAKLQRRARRHGRSTEEEVRDILRSAVTVEETPAVGLGTQLRQIFANCQLDEDIEELRGQPPRPADFSE